MSGRVPVRWTPAARARVLELYDRPDTSGTSIAAVILAEHGLHVTASSLIGIAHRANRFDLPKPRPPALTYEQSRIRNRDRRRLIRAATRGNDPVRSAVTAKLSKLAAPKPAKPPKTSTPKVARPAQAIVRPSLGIPLVAAPNGACRFIADDPRSGPALVCGHPVAPGSPWCLGHRAMCVVPTRAVWIPDFRRAA